MSFDRKSGTLEIGKTLTFEVIREMSTSDDENRAVPWGLWPTLGFTAIVLATYFGMQVAIAILYAIFQLAQNPNIEREAFTKSLSINGFLLSLSVIGSAPICTALTIWFAKLRKNINLKIYLGFRQATIKDYFLWLIFLALYIAITAGITNLLKISPPPFVTEIVKTAYFPPALYLAIVVIAPIFEEVLFRGFLFEGIRRSRLGSIGSILITSLLWTIIHTQYDLYFMGVLFALGILLGMARLKTGSAYLTILLHSVNNLLAVL